MNWIKLVVYELVAISKHHHKHSWLCGVMVRTIGKWSGYPGLKLHFCENSFCSISLIGWKLWKNSNVVVIVNIILKVNESHWPSKTYYVPSSELVNNYIFQFLSLLLGAYLLGFSNVTFLWRTGRSLILHHVIFAWYGS